MDENSIAQQVGQQAEIRGTARNAMAGAVVLTEDRTPVYIDGLERWDDSLDGSEVRVTGTLTRGSAAPQASTNQQGEVSHGMEGGNFIVQDAKWEKVEGA
jgi:hypothetical protein